MPVPPQVTDVRLVARQQLEQRTAALQHQLQQPVVPDALAPEVDDFKSLASESADAVVADVQRAHALAELRACEAALARLEAGNWGVCSACGSDIDLMRLLAMPTAQTCVRCQDMQERQGHPPHH